MYYYYLDVSFHMLKIKRMAAFCNLCIEQLLYVQTVVLFSVYLSGVQSSYCYYVLMLN